jgi:Sugar phosphate permease
MTSSLAIRRWWTIMPIVFITYSLAYLDRANFGFASAAGINQDLGISKGLSSLIGALFFLGYFFFQIPGAIYAERRSVKKLVFWSLSCGAVARPTGMVSNIPSLMVIRFVLGVVEAAVMPAMLIFISNWFTKSERSRANTFLILGNPVTVLWMSVVSGYLVHSFGWRHMFIAEGAPAISGRCAGGSSCRTSRSRCRGSRSSKRTTSPKPCAPNRPRSSRCAITAKRSARPRDQAVRAIFLLEHRRVRFRAVAAVDPEERFDARHGRNRLALGAAVSGRHDRHACGFVGIG